MIFAIKFKNEQTFNQIFCHLQLSDWNSEVGFVEAVRNVPTQWPKFTSFLDESMEEAKSEGKFLENLEIE